MKIRALILPSLLLLAGSLQADYALPVAKERLILLLDGSQVRIDKSHKTLTLAPSNQRFSIDGFWMQDRIWSDGICVGVRATDARSSISRIKGVVAAIARRRHCSVLVELVRIDGKEDFMVTYLKVFDAASEYSRYFPKRQYYDTVDLSLPAVPKDSTEFARALDGITKKSLARLARK